MSRSERLHQRPHTERRNRVPAEGLLDEGVHIRERFVVREVRKSAIADLVDLSLGQSLYICVDDHSQDE